MRDGCIGLFVFSAGFIFFDEVRLEAVDVFPVDTNNQVIGLDWP